MRNRRAVQEQAAEVARRRLELLSAELAGIGRSLQDEAHAAEPGRPVAASPQDEAVRHTPGSVVEPVPAPAVAPAAVAGDLPGPGRHAHRPVSRSARGAGWVRDRLPPTLQGTVALSSSHVTVVAVLVAGALAVTTWWVLRAEADPVVMAPAAVRSPATAVPELVGAGTAVAAGPAPGATAGPGAESAVVVVDVAGKVRRPGIATLPVGSRVVDALEAAGGVRRGVDLTSVNLARVLVDGEQIIVGVPPPGGVAAPAASAPVGPGGTGVLVNLNTATQAQLEELPGVGPVTAQAILQWRTDHGAFSAVDELLEVSGIGEATLAELAPFVTL